ncbi:30S ribosomal protein S15 [Candidatus Bathyarchaeota archaeon]|nr:30S ribosomal protein S15 [Candidatus Bathyarchaeota archaeon]
MPKKLKGRSHQTRPVTKRTPAWCRYTAEEVEALVIRLAKEGHPLSKIGIILRDQHGIPLTKPITGKSVSQILKERELAPSLPEDLENLMRKATRLHVHLDKNKADLGNKRALQIIEAKIYKLARYYKHKGVLPPNWKYEAKATSLI